MTLHGAAADRILRWSIRSSFRNYVSGLPDGSEKACEGAVLAADGRIEFPDDPSATTDPDVLPFRGLVEFHGYGGVLDVLIREPWIHLAPDGSGSVSIVRPTGRRDVIARFTESAIGDAIAVPAPRLVTAGVSLLGDVYEPGAPLDPIDILEGQYK